MFCIFIIQIKNKGIMELNKENVIDVLFSNITDINIEFEHEFAMEQSGDCTPQISSAYDHAIAIAYDKFAISCNCSQEEVDNFINNEREKLSEVYGEIIGIFEDEYESYEMGCLISAEFTPSPDYKEAVKILKEHKIEIKDLRIFMEDEQEFSSFASELELAKHELER